MATRYVGMGGNDSSDGSTWALRKLTLNGVEDIPVVAGDDIYVGPGTYPEQLTCDADGGSGTEITYIADVTGENTDGVGGIIRVTGSDDNQTNTRNKVFDINGKNYRTFRGFYLDGTTSMLIEANGNVSNLLIEDCVFQCAIDEFSFRMHGAVEVDNVTIRRCVFIGGTGVCIDLSSPYAGVGNLVENCIFYALVYSAQAVLVDRCDGWTVNNCTTLGYQGFKADNLNSNGYTLYVYNCILSGGRYGFTATATGGLVEDYNTIYGFHTDRANVDVGANSKTYPPFFLPPILHSGASQISGFKFPWRLGELSEWSQVQAITGNSERTEDLHGTARPATASKNSWGAVQFHDTERDTGTVRTGSVSIALHDAGVHQIWKGPVTAVEMTVSVYVYREADYAGTNPRLVIKQPGQADDVTTDAAAASQWNLLTTTFTPAAEPGWIVIELQSLNTAAAGDYDVFFDDLA